MIGFRWRRVCTRCAASASTRRSGRFEAGERLMALRDQVGAGVQERLRGPSGRRSGECRAHAAAGEPVAWPEPWPDRVGGLAGGVHPPQRGPAARGLDARRRWPALAARGFWTRADGRSNRRLSALAAIERRLWEDERAAHSTARLSPSKRLPVYLNAIEAPSTGRRCGAARAGRRGDGGGDAGGTGASVRRGEVLEMGRRALGAGTGRGVAAVPVRDRRVLRRRALRRGRCSGVAPRPGRS